MRTAPVALLLSLVTACSADRVTTMDPAVTLASEAWSGGTLIVRSPSFTGADSVPIVTLGAETLAVRSGGGDSALVQLPDTGGPLTLDIRLHGGGHAFAELHVYGFTSWGPGPDLDNLPVPWPRGLAPTALAIQAGRLVAVNYRTGSVEPLIPDTGLGNCAPPLATPSVADLRLAVIKHGCGPLIAVPVTPDAPAPDTGPPVAPLFGVHLSRGSWLIAYKHNSQFLVRQPAGDFTMVGPFIGCNDPTAFVVSPRGDRLVLTQCYGRGIPVIDPTTAAVTYTLSLGYIGGAAFSPSGDTLYVAGSDSLYSQGTGALLAVDATTGATLARVPLESAALELAADPGGPLLYAAGGVGTRLVVGVFDRASLSRLATLRVPAATAQPCTDPAGFGAWDEFVALLDPVERHLYLTSGWFGCVYRFDLMP